MALIKTATLALLISIWCHAMVPVLSVAYRLAWLAPEDTFFNTKAGSTVGALQKAITTVESTILPSDTVS